MVNQPLQLGSVHGVRGVRHGVGGRQKIRKADRTTAPQERPGPPQGVHDGVQLHVRAVVEHLQEAALHRLLQPPEANLQLPPVLLRESGSVRGLTQGGIDIRGLGKNRGKIAEIAVLGINILLEGLGKV